MLEDLRALVEFARAGSIAGAADRLFRTPSAITRQVQRRKRQGLELITLPRIDHRYPKVLEVAHVSRSDRCAPRQGDSSNLRVAYVDRMPSFLPRGGQSRCSSAAGVAQSAAAKCAIWSACAFTKDGRAVARAT